MSDIPQTIEALGQHTGKCEQCQIAARKATGGSSSFWDEEAWETWCCSEGFVLRKAAIEAFS